LPAANCIICSSPVIALYDSLYDDRFGYSGLYEMSSCPVCSHKRLRADFTAAELASLYTSFYPGVALAADDIQPYAEKTGFTAWIDGEDSFAYRWVPRNVRILDIGCGFGESLGYHKNRGCDVFGVETDENVRLVADKFGCTFHSGFFDPDNYQAGYFDYVTLDQVIEHFPNPVDTMSGAARLLKKGGVAVVCTPHSGGWGAKTFGKRWVNWHAPYHLHLFSAESMRRLAEDSGFFIESQRTVTSSTWLYYQMSTLVRYPAPGDRNIFWTFHDGNYTFKERLLRKAVVSGQTLKLYHLLTRMFDLLGMGDNFVFILRKK